MNPSTTAAIEAFHQTFQYRTGFHAGVINKVGVCNSFNGQRNYATCVKGFNDAFNNNIKKWEQTDAWKYGVKSAITAAKLKVTSDSVGTCDIPPFNVNASINNLCVSAYDQSQNKGGK